MSVRSWPTNGDYMESVQDPEWCFNDADLQQGTIAEALLGLPECASGQNAIVFPIRSGGKKWAVRCFTTAADEGITRYNALSAFLATTECAPLVQSEWIVAGIKANGDWWPIVKMEWVEGLALHRAVERDLERPDALSALANSFQRAVRDLRNAKVAHGDLQHGNVLVDSNGAVRFVDYDSIWLPSIAASPPAEVGHPNYQHPQRVASAFWDEYVDTFSTLTIYTSVRALAADPSLWEFHNGENLILTNADFLKPSATPIWGRLARNPDKDVVQLAGLLETACKRQVDIAYDFDEIFELRRIPEATAFRSKKSVAGWWESDYDPDATPEDVAAPVKADWNAPVPQANSSVATPRSASAPSVSPTLGWAQHQMAQSQRRDSRTVLVYVLLALAVIAAIIAIIIVAGQ